MSQLKTAGRRKGLFGNMTDTNLLTTTLYKFDVQATALPAYKAVVVIVLVVLSAPVVREKLASFKKSRSSNKSVKEAA